MSTLCNLQKTYMFFRSALLFYVRFFNSMVEIVGPIFCHFLFRYGLQFKVATEINVESLCNILCDCILDLKANLPVYFSMQTSFFSSRLKSS